MSGDRRDEDHRPNDWLFHILTRIEEQQTRHAAEMRNGLHEMRGDMHEMRETMRTHQIEDTLVASDVHALKARLDTASEAKRHAQTLLLSTGLIAVWEGAKHFLGWK